MRMSWPAGKSAFWARVFRHKGYHQVSSNDPGDVTEQSRDNKKRSLKTILRLRKDKRKHTSSKDHYLSSKTRHSLYDKLDQPTKEIRVLRLSPFRARRGLHCTLEVISLDSASSLDYTALSYACGDSTDTTSIAIGNQQSLRIPSSLYTALLHLQSEDEYRIFWSDAICINQTDIEEKGHQIRLMKEIYQRATLTLVWLGPAIGTYASANDLLFDTLTYLGDHTDHFDPAHLPSSVTNGLHELATFKELLQRAWWSRLWILQEVVLAREVIFQCGDRTIDLLTLTAASVRLSNFRSNDLSNVHQDNDTLAAHVDFAKSLSRSLGFIYDLRRLHLRGNTSMYGFIELLCKCRENHATDPRDKIFGLVGMTPVGMSNVIEPDYRDSVKTVYIKTAFRCMDRTDSTILFNQAGLLGRDPKDMSFPSWAPDWRLQGRRWMDIGFRLQQQTLFDASGKKLYFWGEPRYGLRMFSRCVDTVIGVSEKMPSHCRDPTSLTCFAKWEEFVGLERGTYTSRGQNGKSDHLTSNVYWRTLLNGAVPQTDGRLQHLSPTDEDQLAIWQRLTRQRMTLPHHWDDYITSMTRDRRVFICASGLIGIGPAETTKGDRIHIVAGSTHPCLLRKIKTRGRNGYRLVGECYIDELMTPKKRAHDHDHNDDNYDDTDDNNDDDEDDAFPTIHNSTTISTYPYDITHTSTRRGVGRLLTLQQWRRPSTSPRFQRRLHPSSPSHRKTTRESSRPNPWDFVTLY